MSYTIVQQPDEYSLSSSIKDYILSTTTSVTLEVLLGADILLLEKYTPDTDGLVYVRDLGKLFDMYLHGDDYGQLNHLDLFKTFTVRIDGVALDRLLRVLKCKAYSAIAATEYINGSVFLNLINKVKRITPGCKELLTCRLSAPVKVFVTHLVIGKAVNSEEVVLDGSSSNLWTTLDVSLDTVALKFPAVDKNLIIAIRVRVLHQIMVLMIDRNNYLLPLEFAYKNYFDMWDSIVTRGNVVRGGNATFETAKVNRVTRKYNVERNDDFEVSSGKLYSLDEYDRYREMFNSEDVQVYFNGKFRKVVITEENSSQSLRLGNIQPIGFKFQFADTADNNFMTSDAFFHWVLENGHYIDTNMWTDDGHWKDS